MKKGKLYWVTLSVCATYVFCLAILATGLGISAAAPPFSFPDSNSTQLVSSPVDTNWWRAPRGVTTNKATFASVSAANSIAYKEFTNKHAFHVSIALNIINVLEKKSVSYFLQQAPCSLRHRIRALTILHDMLILRGCLSRSGLHEGEDHEDTAAEDDEGECSSVLSTDEEAAQGEFVAIIIKADRTD